MENKKEIITQWLIYAWNKGSIRLNDDLHITEIDPLLSKKHNKWIKYGFIYLKLVDEIKNELGILENLYLRVFLKEEKKIIKRIDLQNDLNDRSPPSLYLFDKKSEQEIEKHRISFLKDIRDLNLNAFYSEYIDPLEPEIIYRSVLFCRNSSIQVKKEAT